MSRVALDSNLLAYYAGVNRGGEDARKVAAATAMIQRLEPQVVLVAPVQALGELHAVLTRTGRTREEATRIAHASRRAYVVAPTLESTLLSALDLATTHRLQIWDALILTAAAEAGCSLLLSEDMQSGFVWRGTTVADPFAEAPHPRLAALLA